VYKSIGDLVTGVPVNILRYLEKDLNLIMFLVLFALKFLIVEDSSMAVKHSWFLRKSVAYL
jgi:hypothetical protein